jgi:hypothetical protein
MYWENYFLKSGESFNHFWADYLKTEKDILFIMGIGFDFRTNVAIKEIFSKEKNGKRDVLGIRYYKNNAEVGIVSDSNVKAHLTELEDFLRNNKLAPPIYKDLIQRSEDDKNISSISATRLYERIEEFDSYSDVIVDISAMPRGIFIPLLNKLLDIFEKSSKGDSHNAKNLHVVVTENSLLDSKIYDNGTAEEATYIHGFKVLETVTTAEQKKIWLPILGEAQTDQFIKLKQSIEPVETCPILPFPSKNFRRGDNLIDEYQDFLFNDSDFEPKNIIYADESNPFQVYRLLTRTIDRYCDSFKLLNDCKIVISSLSSKLLTIGAFLAVYEAKKNKKNVGIKHVESLKHRLAEEITPDTLENILLHNNLVEIWLSGDPYES